MYRKDKVKLDGSDPMLLDAYGSYGICNDPSFDRNALSLLDRGFIYAIAHVRGGGELGRYWWAVLSHSLPSKFSAFEDIDICSARSNLFGVIQFNFLFFS